MVNYGKHVFQDCILDKGLVLYNKYLNRTWLSYVSDIRYIKTRMYKHEKDKILTVLRL